MEVIYSSETSVDSQQTTLQYIPEYDVLQYLVSLYGQRKCTVSVHKMKLCVPVKSSQTCTRELFKRLPFYKQNILAHITHEYMTRSGGISASRGGLYASNFTRNTFVWVSNLPHQLKPFRPKDFSFMY
jgi:hypothetical protein